MGGAGGRAGGWEREGRSAAAPCRCSRPRAAGRPPPRAGAAGPRPAPAPPRPSRPAAAGGEPGQPPRPAAAGGRHRLLPPDSVEGPVAGARPGMRAASCSSRRRLPALLPSSGAALVRVERVACLPACLAGACKPARHALALPLRRCSGMTRRSRRPAPTCCASWPTRSGACWGRARWQTWRRQCARAVRRGQGSLLVLGGAGHGLASACLLILLLLNQPGRRPLHRCSGGGHPLAGVPVPDRVQHHQGAQAAGERAPAAARAGLDLQVRGAPRGAARVAACQRLGPTPATASGWVPPPQHIPQAFQTRQRSARLTTCLPSTAPAPSGRRSSLRPARGGRARRARAWRACT